MKKLKSVKEVKELTGLSSKQLYDYDVLGIVKPSDRKHRGYEKKDGTWYDGYKMYDDEAFMKLQQIGIFNRLHVKRSVIKEKMTSKNYDAMAILDEQMELLLKQKAEIEDMILVIEQLKLLGMKGDMLSVVSESNFHELARKYKQNKESVHYQKFVEDLTSSEEVFEQKAVPILEKILDLNEEECNSKKSFDMMHRLVEEMAEHLGYGIFVLICSYAIGLEGNGMVSAWLIQELGVGNAKKLELASTYYMENVWNSLFLEATSVFEEYHPSKSKVFDRDVFSGQLKGVFRSYLGVRTKDDYEWFFEMYPEFFEVKNEDVRFIMNTLKEHCV